MNPVAYRGRSRVSIGRVVSVLVMTGSCAAAVPGSRPARTASAPGCAPPPGQSAGTGPSVHSPRPGRTARAPTPAWKAPFVAGRRRLQLPGNYCTSVRYQPGRPYCTRLDAYLAPQVTHPSRVRSGRPAGLQAMIAGRLGTTGDHIGPAQDVNIRRSLDR